MTNEIKTISLNFSLPHDAADLLSEWLFAVGALGIESQDKTEFASLIGEETPDYQAEDYLEELSDEVKLKAFFRAFQVEEGLKIACHDPANYAYSLYSGEPETLLDLFVFEQDRIQRQVQTIADNLGWQVEYKGWEEVVELDWAERWKEFFQPLTIGDHLYIRPAWRTDPVPEGRILVNLEPGAAFGSGTHPSTDLCLRMIDREFAGLAAESTRILDLGCGTGILGLAIACLSGARPELIDLDPYAVERARANLACNGLNLDCHVGQLADARTSNYDYLIANLITRLHRSLMADYYERLRPGGKLLLSGILSEDAAELSRELENCGFRLLERRDSADWSALWLVKEA